MKKIFKLSGLLLLCMALVMPVLTSCENDDFDTQQYKGGVSLNVWGPRPVARGGELRFLGSGMDQITSITLPGTNDITDIRVISSEEIRITVPQDAEPGFVVLHHANGDIKSITELTFTEPISIDEIAPMSIKPGAVLTIKGDYLNLISEVILAEEVTVDEEDFITHTRKEISFTVPAEAQSGKVIISDGAEPIPNLIESEEEITVVLPLAVNVLNLTGAKPGQSVVIPMTDIDLVTKLVMPNDDEVEFTVNDDKLSFTLPTNVSDGSICVITASGIKVAVATIGVAVPEEVEAVPADNVWSGDAIKFKGINMELVTEVSFPNVADAVAPDATSPTEITITIPEGTQSGNAVLHTASGASVEVAISTIKPENVAYNPTPAALAGTLTINGKNLQNVVAIDFAGTASVEVKNPEATSFSISVPATLQAGSNAVTLVLSNGEKVEAPAVELTAPTCAYATELPAEDAEIKAGETFILPIANENLLTEVQVDGQKTQHILQGTNLIILVPESAGPNSKVTLVSSNGSISYDIPFIAGTHVENVIMNEVRDLGSWAGENDGGAFRLYKDVFKDVPAGAKLVFHVNSYAYTQIQLNDANWGQFEMLQPDQSETLVTYELSADILNRILTTSDGWSETAMVIQGEGTVVSKVHIEWERSLETKVEFAWGADVDLGNYSINLESGPGTAFIDAGVKVGQTLRLYCTPTAAYNTDDPQVHIQIFDGHWGGMTFDEINGGDQFNEDTWGDMSLIEIKITQDIYDKFVTYTDWGYCIIFQGKNIILNKVTLQ